MIDIDDPLITLERAESAYLTARGWVRLVLDGKASGLWIDPENLGKTHIDRKAAYLQRQRDAVAANSRLASQRDDRR